MTEHTNPKVYAFLVDQHQLDIIRQALSQMAKSTIRAEREAANLVELTAHPVDHESLNDLTKLW